MIRRQKTDADGHRYTVLVPENAADVERIRKMSDDGSVDTRSSFGDDPASQGLDEGDLEDV